MAAVPTTIAYVVSRFPLASETFIVRELNALDARDDLSLELLSLFAPSRPFAHPDAERWLPRVRRPTVAQGAAATLWWAVRRPAALARAWLDVVASYARRPRLLTRAAATLVLSAAHARHVRDTRVAHLHAHFATYPALCAWLCRRLTGCSYSVTAHAHDIFVDQSHLRSIVGEASFVAVISAFNERFLAPYGAGRDTLAHVVRCGVDPTAYPYRGRAVPADGPVRALCVASLEEYKGHRVLLEALAREPRLARIELDLVGAGSLEDSLRAQTARLGLAGRVRFLEARSEPEVAELLASADLFVLPSVVAADGQMEGIPVALMEALAVGVPVVATRLSGIPELVQDGVTGLLAEPGDPDDLAQVLRRALDDGDAALARADAGRALVEREFDVRRSAARIAELLRAAASADQPADRRAA